jgi:hypothetical protein
MKMNYIAALVAAMLAGAAHAGGSSVTITSTNTSASGAAAGTAGFAAASVGVSGPGYAAAGASTFGAASAEACRCLNAHVVQYDKAWAAGEADKGGAIYATGAAGSITGAAAFKLEQQTLKLELRHDRGYNLNNE